MNWVDELLSKIHFIDFYPRGKSTGPNQIIINCPFHEDEHASMSINAATGMYYCHTCNEKGNFLTWCKKQNLDLKQIAAENNIKTEQKKIDKSEIDTMHQELIKNETAINWLKRKRGLEIETVKKYKIGAFNQKFTIPIYDIYGEIVNIRIHDPRPEKGKPKVASWKSGYGAARLFPAENLYKNTVMLCEGEMDCILANQLGYNAITGTTGVSTFPAEWAKYFSGKKVMICYDIDEAGKAGSQRVAKLLSKFADAIKIINLPLDIEQYPGGDLTDYIINGAQKKDLIKLLKSMPLYILKDEDEDKFFEVSLAQADHGKYNNKFIRTSALISGKDIEAYIVPQKIHATCSINYSEKACPVCPMNFDSGDIKAVIEKSDENILLLCDVTKKEKTTGLKEILGIPQRCNIVNIEEKKSFNIEEVVLTTEIEYTTDINQDEQFKTRRSYYIGHNIEANRSYDMEAKTIAHPKTQKGTHLIFNAKPSMTAIDSYEFTDETVKKLEKFQTDNIEEKIQDIYESTVMHVTGLKGREDLFTLTLLTYCSPLVWSFEDKQLDKGYLESLVLGDTRTGKTEMIKSLIEYFKLGELVLGESASFAGLVGGLQQMGSRWHLTWGRIPLNDKRLVAVDEMSGLALWEIAKLSGIRSSGRAEITKIRTEKTWARTRLIWLSNPRGTKEEHNKMLGDYSQGVRAFPELVGQKEDMSRFDLVLLLGIDDVSMDIINTPIKAPKTFKYVGDDFRDLIMFAWTLKKEQITFTQEAMNHIYQCTKWMAFKYDESIPLMIPNSQRVRLAKIAVATAAMVFSHDGRNLIVNKIHVEFAYNYLCKIFDKPVMGYDEYSRLEKTRKKILNEDEIKELLVDKRYVIDQLLEIEKISQTDLQEMFDLGNRGDTRKLLNKLLINKALKRISGGYEKTRAFSEFLRTHKNGELFDADKVDERLEEEEDELPF